MAWDSRRRASGPRPGVLRRTKICVDELELKRSKSIPTKLDLKLDTNDLLSPIEEEAASESSEAPLHVKLSLKFLDPVVRSVYNRTYSSSLSFVPTDRVCQGLLRRIGHCSQELITRKDSGALTPTQCLRRGPKDLRFEMSFQIHRKGYHGVWAERTFKSYQKQPLTTTSAIDILRSTHSIIGVFLKSHDDHFKWVDEPSQEYFSDKPATFKPSLTGPLDLACIPRTRFIESTQSWEVVPGYTLQLTLESRNPSRHQPVIKRILKVDSTQTAPLNLGLGEDLLWRAYRAVENELDSSKDSFDIEHADCEEPDGVSDCSCQHFDEDALKLELRSINNLGPTYEHLSRDVQSRLRLFKHPTGQDCDEFVDMIRARFLQLRDRTDEKLGKLSDFDFRIAELIGHGWHLKNPARFTIDCTQRYTRRSIEALLDRIRTSVGEVLRGHDVAIHMIAYKRGHLILDKALIARNHQESPVHTVPEASEHEQKSFVAQLTVRIQEDIDMICKDTCSLEDIPDDMLHYQQPPRLRTVSSRPFTPRSKASQSSLYTQPGSPSLFTHTPIPPSVPSRSSSIRAFPLVPTSYKDKEERPVSANTSARTSAVDMDIDTDSQASCGVSNVEASASMRVPSIIVENYRGDDVGREEFSGLKPAAELKRARDTADDSNSSILTCSSMPALTESDTPSPEQSMLTTPDCVRSSSPQPGSLLSYNDLDSSPLEMATSDLSIDHHSVPESFMPPSYVAPKPPVFPPGRPITPPPIGDAQDSTSPVTPKARRGSMTVEEDARVASKDDMTHVASRSDATIDSVLHDMPAGGSGGPGAAVAEVVSSEVTQNASSMEGWLLHTEEVVDEEIDTAPADSRGAKDIISIDQCDSSEASKPQFEVKTTEQQPTTVSSEKQTHRGTDQIEGDAIPAKEQADEQVLCQLGQGEDLTQSSGASETPVPMLQHDVENKTAHSDNVNHFPTEDDMSSSEAEKFDENEDDEGPEEAECSQQHLPSISETGHPRAPLEAVVDSEQGLITTEATGTETSKHIVLSQTGDSAPEARPTVLSDCIAEPEKASSSVDTVNRQDQTSDGSYSITDQVSTSVPILPPDSAPPSADISSLAPNGESMLDPENSVDQCLSESFKLGTDIFQDRSSLSSASGWEDCASEARQSIDSVDTVRLTEEDDDPAQGHSSSKCFGTPTAGLLGLRESRWVNFGIRGALTGTHAFDKVPTETLPQSPRYEAQNGQRDLTSGEPATNDVVAHTRPSSSQRKMLHLRRKKSSGSVMFPGPHIKPSKLNKKDTKEQNGRERTKREDKGNTKPVVIENKVDDSATRFPRAMTLVAGLAIVSSVINKSSA